MNSEKLPISAFIICQDEEQYLANCIHTLVQCKEIIIVDSGSKDGTASLVKRFQDEGWPIRFIFQKWLGYAGQKQFAMDQCTEPWLLNIDADERLDEEFRSVLPQLLKAPEKIVAWRLRRRPYLIGFGYTPKFVYERANLRLVRKGEGKYDLTQRVHEGIVPTGTVKNAPRGSLLHFRPIPIDEQILKENKYSALKAQQIVDAGKRPRLMRLVFNPFVYFFRLYLHHRMFLCGFPGLIQAATGSMYSFLTEAKIYQRWALVQNLPKDDLNGELL